MSIRPRPINSHRDIGAQRQAVFDVRDYGATGDGTTDDSAAIQDAIDEAGIGGALVFPKPVVHYAIGASLVPLNHQKWTGPAHGHETDAPLLKAISGFNEPVIEHTGTLVGWMMRDMMIQGRNAAGSMGVSLNAAQRVRIADCRFGTFGDEAIKIVSGVVNYVMHNFVQNALLIRSGRAAYVGAIDIGSTDSYVMFNESTASCTTVGDGFIAAIVARGSTSWYVGNQAEISEAGLVVLGNRNRFLGDRADLNLGHGFVMLGASNQVISVLALNNSQDTTNTHDNFHATSASGSNIYTGCIGEDILTKKARYGFRDEASSATAKNLYDDCRSTTAVTAQYSMAASNGSSFNLPRGTTKTLTANSATPDVTGHEHFITANNSTTTITAFTGMVPGQRLTILCNDANTTIQHNGSTIVLAGAGNKKLRSGVYYEFITTSGTLVREIVPFPLGVTADVGNAAKTLQYRVAEETQIWNTALTADRAVTLSTTGAVAGAKFHIVRTAAATGAFNLNVGTGPLKALAPGTWCDVTHDGTNWVLTAYGAL